VVVVDPRGVGVLRPDLAIKGHDYADPLMGVEENLAYNAFLVGKSMLGMRVTDVLAAVRQVVKKRKTPEVVLCGRRDAALVACLATAVLPDVKRLAVEEMALSYLPLFEEAGRPINASNILPGMLRSFGDIDDVLADIAPRKVLVAAGLGKSSKRRTSVEFRDGRFSSEPRLLLDWLGD